MTPSRLKEIKARYEAATEGPWHENFSLADGSEIVGSESKICRVHEGHTETGYGNMLFIAHARQDLSDCHAEIERLKALVKSAHREGFSAIEGFAAYDANDYFWEHSESCKALEAK